MTISFNEIPVNLRTPGVYAEFDSSNAMQGLPLMPTKGLIVGQRLSAGTKPALEFVRVTSVQNAKNYFGQGSMLARMFEKWHDSNSFTEVYCVALDDNAAGVAAVGSLAFSGTATAAGIVSLYIGGELVQGAVIAGDTATDVADTLAAAINEESDLPVTAAADTGTVTITARHKGACGNDIDLRFNYYDGDEMPEGVSVAVTDMANGTGNPPVEDMIAAWGDEWYNFIAFPYTDSVNLLAMETELDRRWGPMDPTDGRAFTAYRGTHSELGTFGDSRNCAHVCCPGLYKVPTAPCEFAASLAATVAYYGSIDPARPFTTLELTGVLPPQKEDRFTLEERNLLLFDGISTFTVDSSGAVRVEKLITMYKTSANGADDASYLYLNTVMNLSFLRYSFRNRFKLKFPRHKLADDGTRFGAGQKVVTPKVAKGEILTLFSQWEDAGLVENAGQFKDEVILERDTTNRNQLNLQLPPDLINQADIFAAQFLFIF